MKKKQKIIATAAIITLVSSMAILFFCKDSCDISNHSGPLVCHYYTNGKIIYSPLPQRINNSTAGDTGNIFAHIRCSKDNGNGSYTYQAEISESNVTCTYPEFQYDGTGVVTAARGKNITVKIYPSYEVAKQYQ